MALQDESEFLRYADGEIPSFGVNCYGALKRKHFPNPAGPETITPGKGFSTNHCDVW